MKETGIIMSGDHPKKILDGTKTMTRRVIKRPENYDNIRGCDFCCPYGQVGDRLWVRETWAVEYVYDNHKPRDIPQRARVYYKTQDLRGIAFVGKWRPSRFMPRWASRITLEITEVRVERLQEITWDDTHKEGILRFDREHPDPSNGGGMGYNRGAEGLPERYESISAFMDLWDYINAKRGYGWEVNPWCWPISFKVVK